MLAFANGSDFIGCKISTFGWAGNLSELQIFITAINHIFKQ
jgi:hypothetical protein